MKRCDLCEVIRTFQRLYRGQEAAFQRFAAYRFAFSQPIGADLRGEAVSDGELFALALFWSARVPGFDLHDFFTEDELVAFLRGLKREDLLIGDYLSAHRTQYSEYSFGVIGAVLSECSEESYRRYGRALIDLGGEELLAMLNRLANYQRVDRTLRVYQGYYQWCVEQGVCHELFRPFRLDREALYDRVDLSESLLESVFLSPGELREFFGGIQEKTLSCYYVEAVYALLWAGLEFSDCFALKESEVCFAAKTVGGLALSDAPELLDLLEEYKARERISRISSFEEGLFLRRIQRKSAKEVPLSQNAVRVAFDRVKKELGDARISIQGAKTSGILYRLRRYEDANGPVSSEALRRIVGLRDAGQGVKTLSYWERLYRDYRTLRDPRRTG